MPGSAASQPMQRVLSLDALRGFSVIGIIAMNVFVFAMPGTAYYNPRAWGGMGAGDLAAWTFGFLLIEDKFRTLFAMMFGAGVAILLDRPGKHQLRAHYARMAVLFLFGFLHATLLFSGDVLRLYALAGLVLPFVAKWRARTLWIAATLLLLLYMAVGGWIAWGWTDYWWHVAHVPGTDPAPLLPAEWAFGADPDAIAHALRVGQEGFAERMSRRLSSPFGALMAAAVVMPTTLVSMLAGMACWRSGLLAGEWPAARALRLAGWLALLSLPPLAGLVWLAFYSDFAAAIIGTNALVWSAPFDILLGIGWGALAMGLFARAGDGNALVRRLAGVGRMALTNYLMTSLILAVIFSSWGLGLFSRTGRLETYLVGAIPALLMLVWSPLWLQRFRQGPAEWLWRSLAQWRALPLRR